MDPYAKFGLDRPSRSAGHWQHTDRQTDRETDRETYRPLVCRYVLPDEWIFISSMREPIGIDYR